MCLLKKTASISLLALLLFNWVGYSLVSSYFEEKANTRLEASLDNNSFDTSQLLSLKIPANHLAYYNSSAQFERVDGSIEISGIPYKYVAKRLYNDSVEFLCIPNQEVMKVQMARDEFFRLVNDLQHTGQGKKSDPHPKNSKNALIVFYLDDASFNLTAFCSCDLQAAPSGPVHLIPGYSYTAEQPPEVC